MTPIQMFTDLNGILNNIYFKNKTNTTTTDTNNNNENDNNNIKNSYNNKDTYN